MGIDGCWTDSATPAQLIDDGLVLCEGEGFVEEANAIRARLGELESENARLKDAMAEVVEALDTIADGDEGPDEYCLERARSIALNASS